MADPDETVDVRSAFLAVAGTAREIVALTVAGKFQVVRFCKLLDFGHSAPSRASISPITARRQNSAPVMSR